MPSVSKSTGGTVEETHQKWSALVYKAYLKLISDLFICMNPLVCVGQVQTEPIEEGKIAPQGMSSWPFSCSCRVSVTHISLSLSLPSVISRQSRKSLSV